MEAQGVGRPQKPKRGRFVQPQTDFKPFPSRTWTLTRALQIVYSMQVSVWKTLPDEAGIQGFAAGTRC